MFKIKATIRGTTGLIPNKPPMESNLERTEKKKGSHTSYNDPPEIQAKRVLYTNEKGILVQPVHQVKACMRKASTRYKIPSMKGKSYYDIIKGGIVFEKPFFVHKIQKWEVFTEMGRRPPGPKGSLVMIHRPLLPKWEVDIEFNVIDDRAEPEIIIDILKEGGLYYGLADKRPENGRFEVIKSKIEKYEKEAIPQRGNR